MGTQHAINTVVVGPTARATLGRTLFTTRIARQKLAQVSYRWSRAVVIPSVDLVVIGKKKRLRMGSARKET
jgi:hypothetical protein